MGRRPHVWTLFYTTISNWSFLNGSSVQGVCLPRFADFKSSKPGRMMTVFLHERGFVGRTDVPKIPLVRNETRLKSV